MKKIFSILSLALVALAFVSCSKNSPEGVVQEYVTCMQKGQYEEAIDLFQFNTFLLGRTVRSARSFLCGSYRILHGSWSSFLNGLFFLGGCCFRSCRCFRSLRFFGFGLGLLLGDRIALAVEVDVTYQLGLLHLGQRQSFAIFGEDNGLFFLLRFADSGRRLS